jgi:ATP-dependent DNA helicase RecQ
MTVAAAAVLSADVMALAFRSSSSSFSILRGRPAAGVMNFSGRCMSATRMAASAPLSREDIAAMEPSSALKKLFGHSSFRVGQEEVIASVLEGKSTAAVLPTAAGKSLCYQLPAVLMHARGLGVTLVVSPLIALMKDQAESMSAKELQLPAYRVDSSLGPMEVSEVYRELREGRAGMLYVSPERIVNERFLRAIKGVRVKLLVVDEAHCISEWGHNFRPDYLRLGEFAKEVGAEVTLALTATATTNVLKDMCERLRIEEAQIVRAPFFRPNLTLRGRHSPGDFSARTQDLVERLRLPSRPPGPTIVYVTLQQTATNVASKLAEAGLPARAYHAGLGAELREEIQDWFMEGKVAAPIVVATIAFGLGVDKSDIRYIYHFNCPRSLEGYAQEVGRSGRDGRPALCEALLSSDDLPVLRRLIYSNSPSYASIWGLLNTLFPQQVPHDQVVEDDLFAGIASFDEPGIVDVALYDLSFAMDVPTTVVKTVLAYLQEDGWLRETTCYIESQKVALADMEAAIGDPDVAAAVELVQADLATRTKRAKWANVDTRNAASALGATPLEILSIFRRAADSGALDLGTSGKIRSRYVLLRSPGRNGASSLGSIADFLFSRSQALQEREIMRLEQALTCIGADGGCSVSQHLCAHFEDDQENIEQASKLDAAASREWGGAEPDPALPGSVCLPVPSESQVSATGIKPHKTSCNLGCSGGQLPAGLKVLLNSRMSLPPPPPRSMNCGSRPHRQGLSAHCPTMWRNLEAPISWLNFCWE